MPGPVLSPAELRACAEKLPRVRLAHLPTPLEEAPRFAAKIGGGVRVFIKRDDCTGLVLGGNKARHNEFLLADALAQGCDMLVWGALVQSNNCRQTAAGCAKLGLECRLYLSKAHLKTEPQGNLLIDYLVGAKVEFTDAKIGPELNALLAAKAEEFRRAGRKPYFWDPPRVVPLAAVSYALCMAEIAEQTRGTRNRTPVLYTSRRQVQPARGSRWESALGAALSGAADLPDALALGHPNAHGGRRQCRRGLAGSAASLDRAGDRRGRVLRRAGLWHFFSGWSRSHAPARDHRGDSARSRLHRQGARRARSPMSARADTGRAARSSFSTQVACRRSSRSRRPCFLVGDWKAAALDFANLGNLGILG